MLSLRNLDLKSERIVSLLYLLNAVCCLSKVRMEFTAFFLIHFLKSSYLLVDRICQSRIMYPNITKQNVSNSLTLLLRTPYVVYVTGIHNVLHVNVCS